MASVKPSSGKKAKTDGKKDVLQQQDVLQAVIIADNFNDRFTPLDSERPPVLFPVANRTLLDFSLEALSSNGIQETFIFCSSHPQQIRNHVNTFWSSDESQMAVTVVSSESFMSLGDAIRELDSKALIRSDFVLMNGGVVSTLPLSQILEKHKACRKTDKGCALTLIYKQALPRHEKRCKEDDVLLAVESKTKKIRFYQKTMNKKSLYIPLEVFQESSDVTLHYDVMDCHICICSPSMPPLYSDNFDYQTFDDLIRGLIVNEEILGNSMYLHIAESGYAAGVSNLFMYDAISQDIIRRWSYPAVPDLYKLNGSRFSHLRRNIYKEGVVDLDRTCTLKQNVVVGRGTSVGENTSIENSVIGQNCRIGANVVIKGSYIWDNVVIGDGCKLDACLLANNVVLRENVTVSPGCILSYKVIIGDYVSLPPLVKLCSEPPEDDNEFGDIDTEKQLEEVLSTPPACDPKYVGVNGRGYVVDNEGSEGGLDEDDVKDVWGVSGDHNLSLELDDEVKSCSSGSEASHLVDGYSDEEEGLVADEEDTVMFYNEVLDSLQRGIEEKIKSDNLILEINSSKYAYNVTMKEVNTLVTKAILKIPCQDASSDKERSAQEYFSHLKPVLLYFMPLLRNYIKNASSQMDCLQSVEDFMVNNRELNSAFIKVLNLLYEKEIVNENVIMRWFKEPHPSAEIVRKQVMPFIQWLQEADEESSDD